MGGVGEGGPRGEVEEDVAKKGGISMEGARGRDSWGVEGQVIRGWGQLEGRGSGRVDAPGDEGGGGGGGGVINCF